MESARWCVQTSETGTERSRMHSKKFAMWPSTGLPLRSSFKSDSGTGFL